VLKQTPCEVHTFDCTYKDLGMHGTVSWNGVWALRAHRQSPRQQEFRTWGNITSSLGHKSVDLLKMDVEGWEHNVLGEFLPQAHPPLKRLAVEIHVGLATGKLSMCHTRLGHGPHFMHLANLGYAVHSQRSIQGFHIMLLNLASSELLAGKRFDILVLLQYNMDACASV